MFSGIDLSSDTATKPPLKMKQAMIDAPLGDEQRGEDPTTKKLEAMIAERLGFSAAMFFPSATMANQVAVALWCEPGNEVIAAENSHIFSAEVGAVAVQARAMAKPIVTASGIFSADEIKQKSKPIKHIRFPDTALVCVENTTNYGGGQVWSLAELNDVVNCAKNLNLKLHMDGARLFNASVKSNVAPNKITAGFDSTTICLSKGLGCPAGAVLAFDEKYSARVLRLKHLMGGALRQSGILAAAGVYALENHVERLVEDHANAEFLARELTQFDKFIEVLNPHPATNIVVFNWKSGDMAIEQFLQLCLQQKIRFSQIGPHQLRAVTHLDVTREDIVKVLQALREILQ